MDFLSFIIFLVVILVISVKQVIEYQRGVMFTMGKFSGVKKPGWRLVIPK